MILGALGKILGSETVIKKGMDLIDDMHTSETESPFERPKFVAVAFKNYKPQSFSDPSCFTDRNKGITITVPTWPEPYTQKLPASVLHIIAVEVVQ